MTLSKFDSMKRGLQNGREKDPDIFLIAHFIYVGRPKPYPNGY